MSVCRTLGGPSVQRTVNMHSSNSHVKPILMATVMKEMGGLVGKGKTGGQGLGWLGVWEKWVNVGLNQLIYLGIQL